MMYIDLAHIDPAHIDPAHIDLAHLVLSRTHACSQTDRKTLIKVDKCIGGHKYNILHPSHTQVDPPHTEEPDSSSKSHRRNFWQGRAFEDYPPGIDSKVASCAGTPSPYVNKVCLVYVCGVCVCVFLVCERYM